MTLSGASDSSLIGQGKWQLGGGSECWTMQTQPEELNSEISKIFSGEGWRENDTVQPQGTAVITCNLDFAVTSWDEEAERLTGYTSAEMMGMPVLVRIRPERLCEARRVLQIVRQGRRLGRFATAGLHKSGRQVPITLAIELIKDPRAQSTGFKILMSPLTAYEQLGEAFLKAEEKYRQLFDSVFDALIVVDPDLGYIIDCNEALCRLAAKARDDIIGQHCRILFPNDDDKPGFMRASRNFCREGELIEQKIVTASGETRDTVVVITSIQIADQQFLQAVFFDITDRKRQVQELRRAKEMAEAANRAKTNVMAMVIHELKTPLTAITGFAGLLNDENLSKEERSEFIATITENSHKMVGLIDRIIELSQIDLGAAPLNCSEFALRELVDEVAMVAKGLAAKEELEFTVIFNCPESTVISTDRPKLRLVLTNLLGNAFKYTDKGRVELETRKADNIIQFLVRDTGPGISRDEIDKIFEPFFRGSRTVFTQKGSGLGLATARKITQLLHGDIQVESEVGKGSTFIVSLESSIK